MFAPSNRPTSARVASWAVGCGGLRRRLVALASSSRYNGPLRRGTTDTRASFALDVALVGPYPPPFGGISAHVERLTQLLQTNNYRVGVYNHFESADHPQVKAGLRRSPLRYWWHLRRASAAITHCHYTRPSCLIAATLALRNRPGTTLATVHGMNVAPLLSRPLVGPLLRTCLQQFDEVIAVNPEIASDLRRHLPSTPIRTLPAFLPGDKSPPPHSAALREFLERSGPMVALSASRLRIGWRGADIYGLDVALQAFAAVASELPDLRMVIFLAQGPRRRAERRYLAELVRAADRDGLAGRILVAVGEALGPAFARPGVVYLRPTRTDGDAVSVREALDMGVPVLASAAAPRPEGVTVVSSLTVEAWSGAIRGELDRKAFPIHRYHDDAAQAHLGLYRTHMETLGGNEDAPATASRGGQQ